MLQELIDTFEELKKYVFIIDRGNKENIMLQFNDDHFYHLAGLHKTNIDLFLPKKIKSKAKQYKYLKSHVDKFENILQNEIKEKDTLQLRIKTFPHILKLLSENNNTILYSLKERVPGSLYDGDFGLFKIFEEIYCLLGLKIEDNENGIIHCAPQSWMASNRPNRLIEYKMPIYMNVIIKVPIKFIQNGQLVI